MSLRQLSLYSFLFTTTSKHGEHFFNDQKNKKTKQIKMYKTINSTIKEDSICKDKDESQIIDFLGKTN